MASNSWEEHRISVLGQLDDHCERLDKAESKMAAFRNEVHSDLTEMRKELSALQVSIGRTDARWAMLAAGLSVVASLGAAMLVKLL